MRQLAIDEHQGAFAGLVYGRQVLLDEDVGSLAEPRELPFSLLDLVGSKTMCLVRRCRDGRFHDDLVPAVLVANVSEGRLRPDTFQVRRNDVEPFARQLEEIRLVDVPAHRA